MDYVMSIKSKKEGAAAHRITRILMRTVTMKIQGCLCTRKVGVNANKQVITWLAFTEGIAMNLAA